MTAEKLLLKKPSEFKKINTTDRLAQTLLIGKSVSPTCTPKKSLFERAFGSQHFYGEGIAASSSLTFHGFVWKEDVMRKIGRNKVVKGSRNPTRSNLKNSFLSNGNHIDRGTRKKFAFLENEGTLTLAMHRPRARCNTLVLGMGSEFMGDDGLGVHAVRALDKEDCPEGTQLIEVGNHVMDALAALQTADRVIVLDVLRAKGKPGTIYRVSLQPGQTSGRNPPSHSLDLFRALHLGGYYGFLDVVLIGMEPSMIDWSTNLSAAVRKALPFMVQAVKDELNQPNLKATRDDTIPLAEKAALDPLPEDLRRNM